MKQFSLATTLLCAALAPLCADNVENMISQNGNGNNGQSQMSGQNNQKRKMEAQRMFEQRWRDN